MKQQKLSPKDNEKFDEFIQKWQRLLNLQNWRIARVPGSTRAMAEVDISVEDRLAQYRTGKTFGSIGVNDFHLEQTAVHELLHIMLVDYQVAVKSGSPEFIMSVEHSLITVLESLLLKDNKCPSYTSSSELPLPSLPSLAGISLETTKQPVT